MLICVSGTYKSGKSAACNLINFTKLTIEKALEGYLFFEDMESLLCYATSNWKQNFVIEIRSMEEWLILSKRPFALLLFIDAPCKLRYERHCQQGEIQDLMQFITKQDELFIMESHMELSKKATIHINNSFSTLEDFKAHLEQLNLANPEWTRPSWDIYFMKLSQLAATRTNCMKRSVAAIITKENRVISTGYNGTAMKTKNCLEGGCSRCNNNSSCGTLLEECLCLHAEENALLEAGRDRANGATMYVTSCPCLGCAKKIAQVGIAQVIYDQSYSMDEASLKLLTEAGVILRKYNPSSHFDFSTLSIKEE